MEENNEGKDFLYGNKITIADIAENLGVSKSTVSRAISGKGRIGKDTTKKVYDYIEKYNYKPNYFAKGLATSKTYNIGVAFPADVNVGNTPFFQGLLLGVCEVAAALDYDVIVTTVKDSDINLLKRLVENNKVDGIILTRNLLNDMAISYLSENGIPFVLVGSCEDESIIQIDNNHLEACEKLVSLLLADGVKKIAMIGGDRKHIVNRYRSEGYYKALNNYGLGIEHELVFLDCYSPVFIEQAVRNIVKSKADCIVCTDDVICGRVLSFLRDEGISVPENMKIASFYDSYHLETHNPPVTAIGISVEDLGTEAGKRLIGLIDGSNNNKKSILDYEIHLRRSTK
ncbi:MAG: transcriptional regulator, LacI family [Anaerocolumna sp.]|jgi:DNA-binding LacI/PurR family transcriptional regulator|nr:transcriptional regulator, LacI family [Anaerocolumna sp.]